MAFSRNTLVAAVAGSLSLAMLTGCPAPSQPTPSPSSSTGTTPTATPTAPATTPASTPASTEPGASTSPNANASPSNLQPTTLRGKVYDLDGAAISSGAKVMVKSLNPSNPFESTVDVVSGSYVVNNVPAGVQLEITAMRDGWTSRTRVETLLPLTSTQPNVVNFGGNDSNDTEGAAYFISKYPEISSVEPADKADNVDSTKLTYKLTLSEPLDATNQRRFANALRVFPADQYSNPGGTADSTYIDLEDDASSSYNVDASAAYYVKDSTLFLDDDATRATVTWDAAGQVATLTFNAPLIANDNESAKYNVALVRTSTDMIQDKDNNQLGYGGFPAANGQIINYAFRETDLSVDSATATSAASRWAQTHHAAAVFSVAEDNTDPQLTGVSVVQVGPDTRIQLTFSEPMAAFNGTTNGYFDSSLQTEGNYTFAVAENESDLSDVELDGSLSVTTPIDGSTGTPSVSTANYEKEFTLTGFDSITVSPTDPKVVRLTYNTRTPEQIFGTTANAIKARVEAVADPAGNAITSSAADSQVKTGTI